MCALLFLLSLISMEKFHINSPAGFYLHLYLLVQGLQGCQESQWILSPPESHHYPGGE